MSRTITALFDTNADAEAGAERLRQAGIGADHVRVHDQASHTAGTGHEGRGLWATIKNALLPDEDRHTYEEGVRRGGFLLTADVDEDKADEAVRALEDANSIDLDARAQSWRSEGWDYPTSGDSAYADDEAYVFGQRETDRGGARVRSYVSETPIHEQIRLRDERRRASDGIVD